MTKLKYPNERLYMVHELDSKLQFVSDSQDVEAIKSHIGGIAEEYDSFFVEVGDGDYTRVYGMFGIVPFDSKHVYRIV